MGLGDFLQCLLIQIPYTLLWQSLLQTRFGEIWISHWIIRNIKVNGITNIPPVNLTIEVNEVTLTWLINIKENLFFSFFFSILFWVKVSYLEFCTVYIFSSLFWQFITSIAMKYIIRQNSLKWAIDWFQLTVTVLNHFFSLLYFISVYSSFPVYLICVYSILFLMLFSAIFIFTYSKCQQSM